MGSLFRSIYTQRRRLITALFALMFIVMIYERQFPIFDGAHIALVLGTLVIFAIVCAVPMIAAMFVIPSLRQLLELWAITLLVPAALGGLFPSAATMLTDTGFAGLIWFAFFIATFYFLYGTLSDWLPCWFSYRGKASFKTRATPQQIMDAIIPSPDPQTYYAGSLQYVGPDPHDEDSFNIRYARGDGMYELQRVTYLETDDPTHHQRYYFIGDVSERNADFTEGVMDVKITPLKNGRNRVVIMEEYPNARLRSALWMWFNDEVGETANSLKAQLEGKRDLSFTGRYWRKVAKIS